MRVSPSDMNMDPAHLLVRLVELGLGDAGVTGLVDAELRMRLLRGVNGGERADNRLLGDVRLARELERRRAPSGRPSRSAAGSTLPTPFVSSSRSLTSATAALNCESLALSDLTG